MKKILPMFAALIVGVLMFSASAQLKIQGSVEGPKKITTIAPQTAWLYERSGHIYYVGATTNRFDEWVWLDLGEGREAAAVTAQDLLDAIDATPEGDSLRIESEGDIFLLTRISILGSKTWSVSAVETRNAYAGTMMLEAIELKKVVKFLTK